MRKCAFAAALSSSRSTITAERTEARELCVERLQRLVLGLQQLNLARRVGGGLDEEIALPVDRTETRLFDLQQAVGNAGDGLGVTEIGLQHRDLAGRSPLGRLPRARQNSARTDAQEKKFGCTIWCASPQSRNWSFAFNESRISASCAIGEVLHLVDQDEVIARLALLTPGVGDEIDVEQPRLFQPGDVFLEQLVGDGARLAGGEQGLPHAERLIFFWQSARRLPARRSRRGTLRTMRARRPAASRP